MSILKICKGETQIENLYDRINYVKRPEAARLEYIYGANVSPIYTYEWMMWIKKIYNATEGKSFFHFVFNPEDKDEYFKDEFFFMNADIANLIANFSEPTQVLMAVHFDKEPLLHSHFIVNNIGLFTGKRIDFYGQKLYQLKQEVSKILSLYGISSIRQKDYSTYSN